MLKGNKRFTPTLWPTLATAIVLPLFIFLGNWQLQRADEKSELHKINMQRQSAEPLRSVGRELNVADKLWRKVILKGRFQAQPVFLLDNQVISGAPGYFVYNVFVSDSTLPVLVNRGWVKANKDRRVLPKLPLSEESITLHGVIKREPVTGMLLAENTDERIAGVIRVQHIDINEINKNYGLNLPGFIVRLSEDSDAGLLRDWPKPGSGRDKHLGYAFQWFAMATAVLVIFIVVNFKTKE